MVKKRSFTLLEIMMAIMIMAIIAGVVGFELKAMMGVHRFRHDTCRVKEQLERAQLLALVYNADLEVTIAKKKNMWVLTTHSDELALQSLNKVRTQLEGIHSISLAREPKHKLPIVLHILSNGKIEPLGALKMEAKDRVRYVDFQMPIQINFAETDARPPETVIPDKPKR